MEESIGSESKDDVQHTSYQRWLTKGERGGNHHRHSLVDPHYKGHTSS